MATMAMTMSHSDKDAQREQFRLLMIRYLQSRPVDAPRDDMRSREQILRDIENKQTRFDASQ